MALPVTIPNTFANATSSIPLSQLDTNFSTLANAVNGLNSGSETLANLKATTANVGVLTVTGNATIGDASTDTVTLNSTLTANTAVIFAAGTSAAPSITTTGDTNTGIFFPAADTIAFAEGGAEAMRIDANGITGFKVTPSTWSGNFNNAIQIGATTSLAEGAAHTLLANNWYYNGADKYLTTAAASRYYMTGGTHIWETAASGTANNNITFTERMRIDSSGNVGIGTSSPAQRLEVYNSATNSQCYAIVQNNRTRNAAVLTKTTNGGFYTGTSIGTDTLCWQVYDETNGERARITSGGFFKQSNTGSYSDATNTYNEFNSDVSNNPCVMIRSTNASYAANSEEVIPSRSATSSYSFYVAASGGGTDIEFKLRGDGNGYADGTWNNNGADYAEFFESANGQALTLGATVVLDGNKVREATAQYPASAIIGVVRPKEPSKASMVVGNTAWNKWANKYLTDDFDRYIMEDHEVVEWEEQVLEREAVAAVEAVVDEEGNEISPAVPAQEAVYKTKQHSYESHNIPAGVTVPADAVRKTHDDKGNKFQHYKLNPAWDKDAEYVNRESRPEWNIIGLLGQVKILKGQPVGDRWIKMRDVSATVEEWMIR